MPTSPLSQAPLLVGRERERDLLRDHCVTALAGRGSLALINGEAGIGKTALAEAACREAAEQGALVLVGRCYDLTETPPYGPWLDLFARYAVTDTLPSPPPAFAARGTVGRIVSPALLARQVGEFLAALTAARPVVLVLEDLHWADPASLDLLRAVSRSLAALRLLIIATYRADEVGRDAPLSLLLPALVREAGAARLDLRPLRDADVGALVAGRYGLPEADGARLVAYLQRRAEGNPLFLDELLRALEGEGALRAASDGWALADLATTHVPALLRQMIERRMDHLGEAARGLLGIAAVIGQAVPLALWGAVGDADEEMLLYLIERAAAARLVDETPEGTGVRFVHALIREAVYEGMSPLRRRGWHRRIAETLASAPQPDADAVAHHFRQAGDPRAALWLFRAGLHATRLLATATATERYEAALAVLAEARRDGQTGGPFATAPENDALAAHIRIVLGDERCRSRAYRRGIADMEEALAMIEALPAPAHAPALAILEGSASPFSRRSMLFMWQGVTGHFAQAQVSAERLVAALADETKTRTARMTPGQFYMALLDCHASLGRPERAYTAYRTGYAAHVASGLYDLTAVISMHALIWIVLVYSADDLAERRRLAVEAEEANVRGPIPGLPPRFPRLPLLVVEGEWDEAHALAAATRALGYGAIYGAVPLRTLAMLALERGDSDLAWAMVRDGLPRGIHTVLGDAIFPNAELLQRVAARLSIAAGDLPEAKAWLETHDRWIEWSGSVPGRAEGALGWAAYHRAAGDPAQARAMAARALDHAATPRQPLALLTSHRALGELETEARRFDAASHHLDAALALADACAAPYERALTLLALAEHAAATGDAPSARAALDEARATFARLGAKPALARGDALAARLDAATTRPAYPARLSAREVEVLRLLAAGKSNREIADALFLSENTVRVHVAHILTKTETENRTAAAAFARAHGLA